jgi:hypothetical protein
MTIFAAVHRSQMAEVLLLQLLERRLFHLGGVGSALEEHQVILLHVRSGFLSTRHLRREDG